MAERHLAGEAEQHVEAEPDDGGEADGGDDEELIAVGDEAQRRRGGEEREAADEGGGLHTFFTAALPRRPLGITARARMIRANMAIWV